MQTNKGKKKNNKSFFLCSLFGIYCGSGWFLKYFLFKNILK
jgi:hypothetical protein